MKSFLIAIALTLIVSQKGSAQQFGQMPQQGFAGNQMQNSSNGMGMQQQSGGMQQGFRMSSANTMSGVYVPLQPIFYSVFPGQFLGDPRRGRRLR